MAHRRWLLTIDCDNCGATGGGSCADDCPTDEATRVGEPMVPLRCDHCGTEVPSHASIVAGVATLQGADPDLHGGDTMHRADVAHAYGTVGWCTVCGGVDGQHLCGCRHSDPECDVWCAAYGCPAESE